MRLLMLVLRHLILIISWSLHFCIKDSLLCSVFISDQTKVVLIIQSLFNILWGEFLFLSVKRGKQLSLSMLYIIIIATSIQVNILSYSRKLFNSIDIYRKLRILKSRWILEKKIMLYLKTHIFIGYYIKLYYSDFFSFYLYPTFLYIFPYVYEKCIGFRCFALASQVKWEIYEFIE